MTRNMIFCCLQLVISLNMLISRFIHVPANNITTIILFFFMVEWFSIVYICHIFFMHSFVVQHLGWFQSLLIMNSAVINMSAGLSFLCWLTFLYFISMPKRSEGRSNFGVSMKLHTDSHSSCTCLLTQQHCTPFPFVPHLARFSYWFFLEYCHSDKDHRKSQCSYNVHYLMAEHIEHFLIYLSVICISSSQNPLLNSISHLLVGMRGFWVFLEVVIYSRNSVVCVMTLIIVSLDVQKVFNLKSCSENYPLSLYLPLFPYVFM
jgi:hypothetical protein